ncbi:hypothetical protein MLD38_006545 [Melastoma candidum]|uniref:Uncharacterized protein n=1 Tax=Melastoma candidum TaxID=119954 RepID=A0ACB9RNS3_9MYRT|nr:hypothetical protein MLD38_006545 [Melastoma candidum]
MGERNHVRWNEENLGEIEANKPVRQRITEPKTPFHPMLHDDEDDDQVDNGSPSPARGGHFDEFVDEHGNVVRPALHDVASSCENNNQHRGSGWTSSEDEAEEVMEPEDEDEAATRFRDHRRAHYDEFLKVRELRSNGSFLEDDDEDSDKDPLP